MEMASSSNVSAEAESNYKLASAVDVSNFVSVKLYLGSSRHKIWKAQMLNLIATWELLHIINDDRSSYLVITDVDMIKQFDELVKAWILSSLSRYLHDRVKDLGTAGKVWMELESIFNPLTRDTEDGDPAEKQGNMYKKVLRLKICNFVLVTLYGRNNYDIWKAHMLYLLEREKLLHIIIAECPFPENKGVHMIPKYDKLVKAWIFTTMDEQLLEDFIDYSSARSIWKELETRFNQPTSYKKEVDVSALREDLKYSQVSTVNVSNFVSVKLSGPSNYKIWKAQMMCLLNSEELLHIILVENRYPWTGGPMTKKYDNLVLGWIFGTMNDQLLKTFTEYDSVQMVWKELESWFDSPDKEEEEEEDEEVVRFEIIIETKRNVPDIENRDNTRLRKELYEAAVEGCWWKAKSILKVDEKAATEAVAPVESYRRTKDASMNNLAHLAGRLAPSFVLSRTTGAALQLQRELTWREEVEKLMLPLELREKNIYMETPAMMFTQEHQDLLKQGECWMKTTAESCSITAALIVTIVFAAAITVPGGSDQESGIPVFKKETAFTIFAVFNAFSLFTAATALLLFLSILTTRFSEKDFLLSLPRRLILGLLTLFLSTTSMIVAFGAILFLVVCDHRPWMLGPICVFACLPISVIVTIKLPLLVDLIQSTYSPILGNQSYLETCKIQRKNTIVFRERKNGDIEDQIMSC